MKQLFTSTHTRVEVRERAYYPLSRGGSWCVQGSARGPVLQSVAAADQRLEDDSGTGGHSQLRLLRHLTSGVGGLGAQFHKEGHFRDRRDRVSPTGVVSGERRADGPDSSLCLLSDRSLLSSIFRDFSLTCI